MCMLFVGKDEVDIERKSNVSSLKFPLINCFIKIIVSEGFIKISHTRKLIFVVDDVRPCNNVTFL